jgi:hypothetical protein
MKELKLSDIRIDGGTQPRTEIDWELVNDYSEKVDILPPVIVYFDGIYYWLADGFHRYHAHLKSDVKCIKCDVLNGTVREAILYSVGANSEHGARRTNEDKRKAVLTLLKDEEWGKWSNVAIAEKCNVHRQFVAKVKDEYVNNMSISSCCVQKIIEESQPTERKFIKQGQESTMDVSNIGKKKKQERSEDYIREEKTNIDESTQKRITVEDIKNELDSRSYNRSLVETAILSLKKINKREFDCEKCFQQVIDYCQNEILELSK